MGKNLLAKAGLVLAPRQPSAPGEKALDSAEVGRPRTAIGAMAQFTDRQSQAIKDAALLKEQLKAFDGSLPTKHLDPKLIARSKWANRHELSFVGPDFEALKQDIASQGGNVQPIKVRRVPGEADRYELIFGHRRHQACVELGIDVLSLVEDLDDKHLFIEMDRENRQRKDLRPFEVGTMYAKALDEGLFSSARKLAEELGIDHSQLSKALSLARLPVDVLRAFQNPLDLQYRWVADLTSAIQKDPEQVLSLAKEIHNAVPKLPSREVFLRLTAGCGTVPHPVKKDSALSGAANQKAKMVFNQGKRTVRIDLSNIDPTRFGEVEAAIKKLLG